MRKHKTKKTVLKRFKITGTGKVLRGSQNARHLRANKSRRRIRAFKEPKKVTQKQARWIKSALGK